MADLVRELNEIAESVTKQARAAGADECEVLVQSGSELSVKVRCGETELVQEAGSRALGIRVFVDKRAASTYTSDMRPESLESLASETVALARLSEPDPLNTLPDPATFATDIPELELHDPSIANTGAGDAITLAKAVEKAAFDYDERITNSDGGSWSRVLGAMAFANSAGFSGGYLGSYSSLAVQPICEDKDGKKRNGYWWTAGRFAEFLEDPKTVGEEAARRTVDQLGADKIDTQDLPIIFDGESGRSILGTLFSVANGSAFYRKSSYLVDREGTEMASRLVTIIDQPRIPRAPGSRPFDGDGLPTRDNVVVEAGVLKTVLCDTYTARKLGRESTGSAGRGVGGSPGPTTSNFIMQKGETSRDELFKSTKKALYVTGMMGFGFNPVTGDFSRGAHGFLVENGEITQPVSEVTISANFDDLLKRIDCVADDLEMRSSIACPTFRISSMTVAGR